MKKQTTEQLANAVLNGITFRAHAGIWNWHAFCANPDECAIADIASRLLNCQGADDSDNDAIIAATNQAAQEYLTHPRAD